MKLLTSLLALSLLFCVTSDLEAKGKKKKPALDKLIDTHINRTFNGSIDKKNLIRGNITYTFNESESGENDGYVAYIRARWGDLNNVVKKSRPMHYENWSGYVKVLSAKSVSIVRGIALEGNHAVGQGKGGDSILNLRSKKMVAWKSGIIGATDGIVIKIELHGPFASGSLKFGKLESRFRLRPEKNVIPPKDSGSNKPTSQTTQMQVQGSQFPTSR